MLRRKRLLLLLTALVFMPTIYLGAYLQIIPLIGCLMPWSPSARYGCIADAARLTGETGYCGIFADQYTRIACVSSTAIYHEDPNICVEALSVGDSVQKRLVTDPNPTMDIAAYSCMRDLQQKYGRHELCTKLTVPYWQDLCVQALEEIRVAY